MSYIGFQPNFQTNFLPTPFPTQSYRPSTPPTFGMPGMALQFLGQMMQALTMMAQGWQGAAGGGSFGGNAPVPYGMTQPGAWGPGATPYAYNNYLSQPGSSPSTGAYGTGSGNGNGFSALATPTDPQDFASYLQAQRLGGSLEGKTGIAQKDAIPGTRFGRLVDSTLWNADVARNYAFQFAAYASDNNALTPEGVAAGAQAFQNMKPEAKLFMQVASVFKGNLDNGPGFYDNPGLKRLLESKGMGDLIGPGVGETDVQTIGAVTKAINRGALTLDDVINSGTISDMPRYQRIIGYVSSGGFAQDVNRYDSTPF